MRLYVKLCLLVVTFLSMAWVAGESGRKSVREVWFAGRCHLLYLLQDQRLEDQLVAEYQGVLRQRLQDQMAEFLTDEGAPPPPPPVLPSDAVAVAHVSDDAASN